MRYQRRFAGFSYADANGKFTGIDVDVCRGVAAAVFGDDSKVKYTPLTAKERFTALQSGEVDMLSRNTTGPPPVMQAWGCHSPVSPIMTASVS